jgi:hypothetical protein
MTLSIMTLSIMTLSIMTLSIMTLSITTFCNYAECGAFFIVMLHVAILNVVMLVCRGAFLNTLAYITHC